MHPDWFDTYAAAYARNVGRLVAGRTLDVEPTVGETPDGPVTTERTVTIERVRNVAVGIDSDGIFAAINVLDTAGDEWTLYSDGTISDHNDRTVGRHELKTLPAPSNAEAVV